MLFRREHLQMTHEYYERHGGMTIVIAQFAPILRTFAPVVAGVAEMGYRKFASYNVVGAVAWICIMVLGGYLLGNVIPGIDKNIDRVIVVVIAISLLPAVIGWLRARGKRA
jgi:membrane-associated protein